MLVTVVMGVYNPEKKELFSAVNSILQQTFKEFEFLICDDGSSQEAGKWLLEAMQKDRRIRILRQDSNGGLAAALNRCIAEARGKYIARMDADDISKMSRLEVQVEFLENHPEYAFVGSNAELIDSNGIWGRRSMPEYPGKKDFLPFSPFIHPSVMVRRDAYLSCGGYQEGKETWRSEDYEIFMRMYALGFCGYNLQMNLLKYRENQNSYQKRKYQYRMDEARIRYRYFKQLKVSFLLRSIYIMKPLVVGLLPAMGIAMIKHWKARNEVYHDRKKERKIPSLSEHLEAEAGLVPSCERSVKAM